MSLNTDQKEKFRDMYRERKMLNSLMLPAVPSERFEEILEINGLTLKHINDVGGRWTKKWSGSWSKKSDVISRFLLQWYVYCWFDYENAIDPTTNQIKVNVVRIPKVELLERHVNIQRSLQEI